VTRTDSHRQYAAAARYRLASTDFGQPLLLLHGLGGSRGQLMQYLDRPDSQTVLAPDLRGHGETELIGDPADFSFDGLTDDLVALLDALRYPPAAVIGVSMGAGVAANLALRYPSRVRALLLIRPAWLDAPAPQNLSLLRIAGVLMKRLGSVAADEVFLRLADFRRLREVSPSAAASLAAQFRDVCAADRSVRLRQLPLSTPFTNVSDLNQLSAETTVVAAPGDPLHPVEIAEAWAGQISGCRWKQTRSRDADPVGYHADLATAVDRFVGTLEAHPLSTARKGNSHEYR
jgi:pimeloyl-ACP methyl ester carboxylesterase